MPEKKSHTVRTALLSIAGFIILLIIVGAIVGGNSKPAEKPAQTETKAIAKGGQEKPIAQQKPDLELLDWKWEAGEYESRYLAGRVKNNSTRNYTYVQISISLYDKGKALVGSTMTNVNNLGPGEVWKFKAIVMEESAYTAKLKDLTGF